jgi:hypothetical protein
MRYIGIAVLSAAATCLVPFAPSAIAELGHPSGCLSCAPVEVPGPSPDYAPATGPLPGIGAPRAATALAPETGRHRRRLANGCHVKAWDANYPREYHVMCR